MKNYNNLTTDEKIDFLTYVKNIGSSSQCGGYCIKIRCDTCPFELSHCSSINTLKNRSRDATKLLKELHKSNTIKEI